MNRSVLNAEQQRMVLDGAVKLASIQDLSSITLDHLTKASGIPAFDIVRHYHSKENILSAALERELELIAGSVPSPELRFPGETLKDELQVLAKIMLQEYRNRLPFMGKLLSESMKNPEVGAILLSLPPPIALELEFVPMLLIKPPAMVAYAELAAMPLM